jgi:ornithine carbamoyltransferase
MSLPQHFLDLDVIDAATLREIVDLAKQAKAGEVGAAPLAGRSLVMIFEKPSTRTRVSFEVGMIQLGGHAITLDPASSQLGRGETVADTARVLSRYADVIMLRTGAHEILLDLATHATVPVINGLTDRSHPCQLVADILTVEDRLGPLADQTIAWVGDGNNVAVSWIHTATHLGCALRLACPIALAPDPDLIAWAKDQGTDILLTEDPREAVAGADCVITDTWVSMGDELGDRLRLMEPYRVDAAMMAAARPGAMFLHCLPAHRGDEVTDEVIDGPNSGVWDEAENRLHAHKGILLWCLADQAS